MPGLEVQAPASAGWRSALSPSVAPQQPGQDVALTPFAAPALPAAREGGRLLF
jgi:hypothetical protein